MNHLSGIRIQFFREILRLQETSKRPMFLCVALQASAIKKAALLPLRTYQGQRLGGGQKSHWQGLQIYAKKATTKMKATSDEFIIHCIRSSLARNIKIINVPFIQISQNTSQI